MTARINEMHFKSFGLDKNVNPFDQKHVFFSVCYNILGELNKNKDINSIQPQDIYQNEDFIAKFGKKKSNKWENLYIFLKIFKEYDKFKEMSEDKIKNEFRSRAYIVFSAISFFKKNKVIPFSITNNNNSNKRVITGLEENIPVKKMKSNATTEKILFPLFSKELTWEYEELFPISMIISDSFTNQVQLGFTN